MENVTCQPSYYAQSPGPRQNASTRAAAPGFSIGAAANSSEDWSMLTSSADRRRLQNRLAQRTYRRNLKNREKEERGRQKSVSPSFNGQGVVSSPPPAPAAVATSAAAAAAAETQPQAESETNEIQNAAPSHQNSPMLPAVSEVDTQTPLTTHRHFLRQPSEARSPTWTPSYPASSQSIDPQKLIGGNSLQFNNTPPMMAPEMHGHEAAFYSEMLSDIMFPRVSQSMSPFSGAIIQNGMSSGNLSGSSRDDMDMQKNHFLPFYPAEAPLLSIAPSSSSTSSSEHMSHDSSCSSSALDTLTLTAIASNFPTLADLGGDTPLHEAASHGYDTVVSILLSASASPCAVNSRLMTPLHIAASRGHQNVCRLLLSHSQNPQNTAYSSTSDGSGKLLNTQDIDGRTPLHNASTNGHHNIVRLLLEQGADVEAVDATGKTALHLSSQGGHLAVVRLLLERGVNVDRTDCAGWTALHRAVECGREVVVRVLIERGANVDAHTDG